jgi:hypothetical protein
MLSPAARSADDMDTPDNQHSPSAYQQDWSVKDLHDHRETGAGVEYLTEWEMSWVHGDDLDGAEELKREYWLGTGSGLRDKARRRAVSKIVSLTSQAAKIRINESVASRLVDSMLVVLSSDAGEELKRELNRGI